MVFNSITFLIFFLIFFQLYWLINNKLSITFRNLFTILASYLFYGWWDWRFLSLILISSITDYSIGIFLNRSKKSKKRKLLLISSIIINIGILGVFKYFNFFIASFNELLSLFSINIHTSTLNIILPVGISFYTFQTLSYTIDIYKRKLEPTKDIVSFFTFVAFFPQLVAGPIERASRLLIQFQQKQIFSYNSCVIGLRLILWGLFKKLVIADNFGILADNIFNTETPISGLSTIIGSLFFAFQIYTDFSGYSDIAIGTSKMLGIDLMKNFKTPYFSASFGEFWQRWHISLSTWFRDYLYIPLGGNRGSNYRIYQNLFITFLVSGLWHGAQITFLIWGALHGIVLIFEKYFHIKKLSRAISIPIVFIIVTLFWIPFRAENLDHFFILTKSLISFQDYSFDTIFKIIIEFSAIKFISLLAVLILFLSIEFRLKQLDISEWISAKSKTVRFVFYYMIVIIILLLYNSDVKPFFIYFQF